jgi:hypothetical protein
MDSAVVFCDANAPGCLEGEIRSDERNPESGTSEIVTPGIKTHLVQSEPTGLIGWGQIPMDHGGEYVNGPQLPSSDAREPNPKTRLNAKQTQNRRYSIPSLRN